MESFLLAHWLDITTTLLGLAYILFEYRASIWLWPVGFVMQALGIVLYYQKGLYADCGMEVYYFLAGLYGLACWLRPRHVSRGAAPALAVTSATCGMRLRLALAALALWAAMGVFLSRCTDSSVPVMDAFTTALSIVALWMLSRKYLEQWLVWMVVDACSVGLYVYKGVYGRALLYSVYTVIAVYGWLQWRRRARQRSL